MRSAVYGRVLRTLRESAGRTQADVARSVGISPAHLARLEAGQRGLYLDDFIRISQALGEKPGDLLPNELGEIAHLKPVIDRLARIHPELLGRLAAIIEKIVQLTEQALAPLAGKPDGTRRGRSRPAGQRKARRR